jgi:hypothetical protein
MISEPSLHGLDDSGNINESNEDINEENNDVLNSDLPPDDENNNGDSNPDDENNNGVSNGNDGYVDDTIDRENNDEKIDAMEANEPSNQQNGEDPAEETPYEEIENSNDNRQDGKDKADYVLNKEDSIELELTRDPKTGKSNKYHIRAKDSLSVKKLV